MQVQQRDREIAALLGMLKGLEERNAALERTDASCDHSAGTQESSHGTPVVAVQKAPKGLHAELYV
jgi:hypothetical protein